METATPKEGLLIIISGPSGVGKGTIRRNVMGDDSLNLVYSVSMTTRSRRETEVDGVDYFFVSREEFDRNIKAGNFLEWAEFVGNRYGTPKHYVDELRAQGKNVVLEIEVEGTKQVLSRCKGSNVVSIFVIPPSYEDLEKRIRHRSTEPEDVIQKRLQKARKEMHLKYHYEYVVLNDRPDRAGKEIREIIRNKINAKIIK
ncbi:MAG: guanylate kinase [Bacilli bacterium]|jgi:guanylate kinase|nr:guanylate kinase [Bacilli bacterium]NCA94870.1 guanylate kinase [Campylobacterota bacterium]NLB40077.1 guanylate kinase [Erysipelotrichaceae bacterium]MDD4303268.1 guanylate kinase [Bacilli bacterium]HOF53427.1 guanylate kinase [Bacilli bacterium]